MANPIDPDLYAVLPFLERRTIEDRQHRGLANGDPTESILDTEQSRWLGGHCCECEVGWQATLDRIANVTGKRGR